MRELQLRGIKAVNQLKLPVTYKGRSVGDYVVDLMVEKVLAVELKCVDRLASEHTARCINYLKACNRTVCLLINFQRSKIEWKRIVNGFEAT